MGSACACGVPCAATATGAEIESRTLDAATADCAAAGADMLAEDVVNPPPVDGSDELCGPKLNEEATLGLSLAADAAPAPAAPVWTLGALDSVSVGEKSGTAMVERVVA